MKVIEKWLKGNDLEFENWTMTDGNKAILVKTDYEGLYPTKETLNKIWKVENKIKRFKKLQTETRGHYTGILIKEIAS